MRGIHLDRQQKIDFLRKIYFFNLMPDESLGKIYDVCAEKEYASGSVLFYEDVPGDSFFIILHGELEIWKRYAQSDAVLLGISGPGEAIGEMALIDERPRSATVCAKTICKVLVVHAKDFHSLLQTDTNMCITLLRAVTMMVRRANESHIADLDRQNKELAKAYSELQAMQEELLNRERLSVVGKFSSLILHDIRNPLSALKSRMELLRLHYEDKAYFDQSLQKINNDISRMEILAAEFLDYSRGEIRLNMGICDIKNLFSRFEDIMALRTAGKNIELSPQSTVSQTLVLDEERMLRALINVAENAIKAMPEGGIVALKADIINNVLVISIADTGSGMSRETLSHIFEPFYSNSTAGGTGLGMLIIKSIVEAHHGTVSVESEEHKGTCVTMRLPVLC